jgi:hypothetical protein
MGSVAHAHRRGSKKEVKRIAAPGRKGRLWPIPRRGATMALCADVAVHEIMRALPYLLLPPLCILTVGAVASLSEAAPESPRSPSIAALRGTPDSVPGGGHRAVGQAFRPFSELELSFSDDVEGEIEASIFSLGSRFFAPVEVEAFLRAMRAAAPRRSLLVLTDRAMARDLSPLAEELSLDLIQAIEEGEGGFTPWPRDPFTFARDRNGATVLVARPNLQPGREADAEMARALATSISPELARRWGGVSWTEAAIPFHNGQHLATPERLWVSIHSLEVRALELLGEDRVPVESFATAAGVDRYLRAVDGAARELGELFGRQVEIVHPLPTDGPPAVRGREMRRLGGGAGYDLDSWLTLLPGPGGDPRALVADPSAGLALIDRLGDEEWRGLRQAYDLAPQSKPLRRSLEEALRGNPGRPLGEFLDLVAEHLVSKGLEVKRLPLLVVPVSLVRDARGLRHEHFFITWNNVVVEHRSGSVVAEGFASSIPSGDRAAQEIFASLGADLKLLPPLVESVILTGGYRCASNHLRRVPEGQSP